MKWIFSLLDPSNAMLLLGNKFCTFLEVIDGKYAVLKAQDYCIPDREKVFCFREYLGYCLGTRLGLVIPRTQLLLHSHYGRVSAQQYVSEAKPVSRAMQRSLATSTLGFRIMLLDLVCGNHDRRLDNLIEVNGTILPIDFNVAFVFKRPTSLFHAEVNTLVMRWFGIEGALTLQPDDRVRLLKEIERLEQLLNNQYLHYCLNEIEPLFLSVNERHWLFEQLMRRRQLLHSTIDQWWDKTIAPLHKWIIFQKENNYERNTNSRYFSIKLRD